jgi:CRISPR-associated endonuclease/helicase Cas3
LICDDAVGEALDRLTAGQAVLVVANSVAQAQRLFDLLGPRARQLYGDDAAVLLHSRFRRDHRRGIEEQIHHRYGTHRTTGGRRLPGLVVATQVVEVSLDVDFDALLTSGAPLEALLQRFGRVNRVAARPPADVVVCQPAYGPRRSSGTEQYADGVYPAEPVTAAMRILTGHDGEPVDEEQANGWLDDIYTTAWGQRWRGEVLRHRDRFTEAFLTFRRPFEDRSALAEDFDTMFDGTEAVLLADLPAYRDALIEAGGAAGRLLAADYLIPLPAWAAALPTFDRALGVAVVDGDYDPRRGLLTVRGAGSQQYQPGEIL